MSTNVVQTIRQSPPLDLSIPYDSVWIKGKAIVITGGASGFGAGFVRHWASYGASIIIGDINVSAGEALVAEVRSQTGNENVHFVHCNVTDWDSQASFFKEAVRLSPHGGLDVVVANAGVAYPDPFLSPKSYLGDIVEPSKPSLGIVDVNLTGLLYTSHLAYFYLPRNPGSVAANPSSDPSASPRDRQLILLGSVASLGGLTGQPQYTVSKHAVLGLFRSIRSSSFPLGIRVNLICPYFIDTPIISPPARVLLAGGGLSSPENVVEAATRFVADSRIVGRALVVGPKVKVRQEPLDGSWILANTDDQDAEEKAIFECYAHDWEDAELFCRRFVGLLNAVERMRGWSGWAKDVIAAVRYGFWSWWSAPAPKGEKKN